MEIGHLIFHLKFLRKLEKLNLFFLLIKPLNHNLHEQQLFLNKQSVNLESLPVSLKPLLANSDGVLIIASDKDAKQGVVSSAMLKAREAGALHFSIIVQSQ